MERLTREDKTYPLNGYGGMSMTVQAAAAAKRLWEYEETGLSPEEVAEFIEKKKSGLILELPCPIGTPCYRVVFGAVDIDGYGMAYKADWHIISITFGLELLREYGKSVFLTREEAEANLITRKYKR